MKKFDLLRLATLNFLRSKIRSFLTILGVVIGTVAIVVMISLGIGMNESFKNQVSQMGSLNIINVYLDGGRQVGGTTKQVKLDDKAITQMSKIKGVDAATPMLQTSAQAVAGKYMAYFNLVGIRPSALEVLDFKVDKGRLLLDTDKEELLFGSMLTQYFYRPKNYTSAPKMDLMTEKIQITFDMSYQMNQTPPPSAEDGTPLDPNKKPTKFYKVKAAGVLAETQDEKNWSVYMNIDHLKKLIRENAKAQGGGMGGNPNNSDYSQAIVHVKDINDVEQVREVIKEMGFATSGLTDVLKGMQDMSKTLRMILGGIGAISLLVAAIGITNTMIMSIYERTREIGIMKVLGCELKDIRQLFLVEAGFIGFFGGILGVGFSFLASFLLNKFGGNLAGSLGGGGGYGGGYYMGSEPVQSSLSVIPLWLVFAAIAFATLIGLLSGSYPAGRAMKLSALEAIKTD